MVGLWEEFCGTLSLLTSAGNLLKSFACMDGKGLLSKKQTAMGRGGG